MVRNIVRVFIPFDSALQLLEISFLGDTQKFRAELQQKERNSPRNSKVALVG